MDSRLIFRPRLVTFDDGVTQKDREATGWKWWLTSESRIPEENPWGHSTVRLGTWPYGRQVSDFTLPGKTSKDTPKWGRPKPPSILRPVALSGAKLPQGDEGKSF
jgi:hypothetical protein